MCTPFEVFGFNQTHYAIQSGMMISLQRNPLESDRCVPFQGFRTQSNPLCSKLMYTIFLEFTNRCGTSAGPKSWFPIGRVIVVYRFAALVETMFILQPAPLCGTVGVGAIAVYSFEGLRLNKFHYAANSIVNSYCFVLSKCRNYIWYVIFGLHLNDCFRDTVCS